MQRIRQSAASYSSNGTVSVSITNTNSDTSGEIQVSEVKVHHIVEEEQQSNIQSKTQGSN